MTTLFGAGDMANVGAPVRVIFEIIEPADDDAPGALNPPPHTLPDPLSRASLERARHYTAATIGWLREHDLSWDRTGLGGRRIPSAKGPSLFGAFCLGFMQIVAVNEPGAMHAEAPLTATELSTLCLNRIAVSAAFEADGTFAPVGKIQSKLAALAQLGHDVCALCVVAHHQPRLGTLPPLDVDLGCFMYTSLLQQRIPIVKAIDAVDAVTKLLELQSGALMGLLR